MRLKTAVLHALVRAVMESPDKYPEDVVAAAKEYQRLWPKGSPLPEQSGLLREFRIAMEKYYEQNTL